MSDDRPRVTAAMRQINDAWIAGRIDEMAALLHEKHGVQWLAVWRTMLDLNETAT